MQALPDHTPKILPLRLLGNGFQVAAITVFGGIEHRRCSLQAFRNKVTSQTPLSSSKVAPRRSSIHLKTSRLRAQGFANVLGLVPEAQVPAGLGLPRERSKTPRAQTGRG